MIPSDVASRLQGLAGAAMRPVANIQEITDRLAGLAPGQRLMAEIQALMPNGTYRAVINQRDVTLALPFSAKAGDALELEVVSTNGKLTLAVLSRPPGEGGKTPNESVPTTLSRTGQLIGSLFNNAGDAKPLLTPTTLNANQPIAQSPPATAQEILPQLKLAIVQSGMFYESHQAEWVEGRLPRNALLQEPQGRLPPRFAPTAAPLAQLMQSFGPPLAPAGGGLTQIALPNALPNPPVPGNEALAAPQQSLDNTPLPNETVSARDKGEALDASRRMPETTTRATGAELRADSASTGSAQTPPPPIVAAPALPLVQQQLEALATQSFVWQGQVWPGQTMRWEIEEEGTRGENGEGESDESATRWQTQLRLTLPRLGEVDAQIRLNGHDITLTLGARSADTQSLLRTGADVLRSQLGEAGLALASVGVGPVKESQAHGPAES
jgi:hypothetical protein